MAAKRTHSPDYPAISLKDAIDRARRLYQRVQGHPAPREIIVEGLGYQSLNGASMSALAALRKYGLLEKNGQFMRVSELTTRLLFPHSDQERQAAQREAGLRPPLFHGLYETFGGVFPDEALLVNHLIRQGFLLAAARAACAAYRDTLPLVSEGGAEYVVPEQSEEVFDSENDGMVSPMMGQELALRNATTHGSALVVEALLEQKRQNVERAMASRTNERRLFDYDFEAGGGVGVVVRGDIDTSEALDVIETWLEVKRKELHRKASMAAISSQSEHGPNA